MNIEMKTENSLENNPPVVKPSQPAGSRRILVVEDDVEVSKVVAQILGDLGYQSIQCNQVQDALGIVQSGRVDLVLVDYRMPELTGLDLILMLRRDGCNIPVVMMSGYATTESRLSAEGLESFTILKKPLVRELLATALIEALECEPEVQPSE